MTWLTGFNYRKKITISAETGAGTDYQVKLLIGKASGATGEDFDLESHCLDTFADIRFTDNDESTELSYWIESVEDSGTSKLATVWVKVADDLSTTNADIYCYYGKADATTTSDGDDTFLEFDDFDGDSIDTNKWDTVGSVSVSGGIVTLVGYSGGAPAKITGKNNYGYNVATRHLLRSNAAGSTALYNSFRMIDADADNGIEAMMTYTSPYIIYTKDGNSTLYNQNLLGTTSADATNYNQWEHRRFSGKVVTLLNDVAKKTYTNATYLPTVDLAVLLGAAASPGSSTLYVDWSLVRKCVETEPDFSSAASEESITTPTVTTQAVDEITATTGDGNGNITATGGASITERGFVYDTTSRTDPGNTSPAASDYPNVKNETGTYSTGAFSLTITGLDNATKYYVRAYAKNSEGYSYGDEVNFTTLVAVPTAITQTESNVTSNSARINGKISDDGGAVCDTRFRWRKK